MTADAPARATLAPATSKPLDCPRAFEHEGERVTCLHGGDRDEFGYVIDDHMHIGFTATGERVEWLSAWQAPRFMHPQYRAWGVIIDAVALLACGLGIVLFTLAVIYGGGKGYYDLSTAERVRDGIAAGLLALIGARMLVHLAYLAQQWGPDPFKGRQ